MPSLKLTRHSPFPQKKAFVFFRYDYVYKYGTLMWGVSVFKKVILTKLPNVGWIHLVEED
jgi:hypothetical protein